MVWMEDMGPRRREQPIFQQVVVNTHHFQKIHITKKLTQCTFGQNSYARRKVFDNWSLVSLTFFSSQFL